MPRHDPNIPHRSVDVPWHIVQQLRRLPELRTGARDSAGSGYRLADLELDDGRIFEAVLVIHDHVIVPDTEEWRFDGLSVVAVRATPRERWPDLAIRDRATLIRHHAYSMADVLRLPLFGPIEDDDGEEEASDEPLDRWAPDLDPCDRVGTCTLTPSGWRVSYQPRPGAHVQDVLVPAPRSAMLWDEILSGRVRTEGDPTLRHLLLTLQAVDPSVRAYIQGYLRLWPNHQVEGAIQAALTVPPSEDPDPDVNEIRVGWSGDTWSMDDDGPDEISLVPDASMIGPAEGDAAFSNGRWSLWGARWATALDLPLTSDLTLIVPPVHDEIMAFLSHERMRRGGDDGPRAPLPERDRYQVPLTWADALGAILMELGRYEPDPEPAAPDPAPASEHGS